MAASVIPGLGLAGARAQDLTAGFVYLRDIDPTIIQDLKYAGRDNFLGRPLPGYGAAECLLKRAAAEALKRVQQDLVPLGLSLKVFDCYRPARAVRAIVEWAKDGHQDPPNRFFPDLEKSRLLALGYIAARSSHSLGTAVDLTLALRSNPLAPHLHPDPCSEAQIGHAPSDELDMGTQFDCFDPKSFTASHAITAEQRRSRNLLQELMLKHGFTNYYREWWHFTYSRDHQPAIYYDFPIVPRGAPER
jgi:D-alanyl-D-alanine dipeptidase